MLSLIIWWGGIALEAAVLFRGIRAKLVSKYPNFYIYALSLFICDGMLYLAYRSKISSYVMWNWYTGFLILFLGCGILLEVFRHVLSPYPGAERFAKMVGFGVFGTILCFAILYPILAPPEETAKALYVVVQRDFLVVQAILLLCLLQVISYYRISMGRNLKGMILGYGQCVGTTLILLALRARIGVRFHSTWSYVQQISYLAALVVWLVALWSYRPNPVPSTSINADADYETFASRTREMVGTTGAELMKVDRL